MFGLSILFKSFTALISFMIFVLILSPNTLTISNGVCKSVSIGKYFCSKSEPSNVTKLATDVECFGAYEVLYPLLLGLVCVFAFLGHLWYFLKNKLPNAYDWILSSIAGAAWFIAFIMMIYVCVARKPDNYPIPPTWIATTILCLILVILIAGEVFTMLKKQEYFYGIVPIVQPGPTSVVKAGPTSLKETSNQPIFAEQKNPPSFELPPIVP